MQRAVIHKWRAGAAVSLPLAMLLQAVDDAGDPQASFSRAAREWLFNEPAATGTGLTPDRCCELLGIETELALRALAHRCGNVSQK